MAVASSTVAALALAAAAAGAQQYNTNKTLSRQDASAAQGIRDQSRIQKEGDKKVQEQVDKIKGSRADDERATRMADYMKTLTAARKKTDTGLENSALGEAFNAAGAAAKGDLAAKGASTAGLLAGVDAAGMQRQGEAFDFGRLATDIGLIGRESQGQQFLTDLRTRSIRRNPWIDVAAATMQGAAGGLAGGAGAAGAMPGAATNLGAGASGIGSGLFSAMRGFGGGP